MFRLSTLTPAPAIGTLKFPRLPTTLGFWTDIDGVRWDVRCITSGGVSACRADKLHPYYTDTSGRSFGSVSQRWEPYLVARSPPGPLNASPSHGKPMKSLEKTNERRPQA